MQASRNFFVAQMCAHRTSKDVGGASPGPSGVGSGSVVSSVYTSKGFEGGIPRSTFCDANQNRIPRSLYEISTTLGTRPAHLTPF